MLSLLLASLIAIPRAQPVEDFAVFDAVLVHVKRGPWLVLPVLRPMDIRNLGNGQRLIGTELVTALMKRNVDSGWLRGYQPPAPHLLGVLELPSPDLEPLTLHRPNWTYQWLRQAKRQKLSGTLRLTLPGYSTSREEAVVYVSTNCGFGLCGEGAAYILRNRGGRWAVERVVPLWVS